MKIKLAEHGTRKRYGQGCRKPCCREANAAYKAGQRAEWFAKELPEHIEHGTLTAYSDYGCRCDRCRGANTDYMREYRAGAL